MGCVSFRSAIGSLRIPLYGGWLSVDLRVYKCCEWVRAEDPKCKEGGFSSETLTSSFTIQGTLVWPCGVILQEHQLLGSC